MPPTEAPGCDRRTWFSVLLLRLPRRQELGVGVPVDLREDLRWAPLRLGGGWLGLGGRARSRAQREQRAAVHEQIAVDGRHRRVEQLVLERGIDFGARLERRPRGARPPTPPCPDQDRE